MKERKEWQRQTWRTSKKLLRLVCKKTRNLKKRSTSKQEHKIKAKAIMLSIRIFHLIRLLIMTLGKALSGVTKAFSKTLKPKKLQTIIVIRPVNLSKTEQKS